MAVLGPEQRHRPGGERERPPERGLQPDDLTPLTYGVIAAVDGNVVGRGDIAWSADGVTSTGRFRTDGLDLAAMQLRIEPRREWNQLFVDAWRILRDVFYEPGMHGQDWPAHWLELRGVQNAQSLLDKN